MNKWSPLARLSGLLRGSRLAQTLLLVVLWLAADRVVSAFQLPLPGSILGLFAVLVILETGLVSRAWFERGADSLLNHLMLFFVPAMLGLVDHRELLSVLGLKLLAAVLFGTLLVMVCTALVVEFGLRLRSSEGGRG